jgi:hypothetical protein
MNRLRVINSGFLNLKPIVEYVRFTPLREEKKITPDRV